MRLLSRLVLQLRPASGPRVQEPATQPARQTPQHCRFRRVSLTEPAAAVQPLSLGEQLRFALRAEHPVRLEHPAANVTERGREPPVSKARPVEIE